nr:BspA family leucine-rich repeat surface protein [Burkholderiaceae bacterium]
MAKGVEVTLYDADDNPYASGTDIAVLWFDSDLPPNIGQAVGQSAIATTTAGGVLSLDLDAVTGLGVGGWGFLLCYKYDGTDHRDSPIFASRMQVTSMSGTTPLTPADGFVRNPDWPAQTAMVDGVQKFTGLLAVFDHPSNFVALSATAAYVVNWGDGSGDIDVASGVTAERNIAYGDVSGVVVGTSKAVNVTFTDSGDTVNRTAHGFQNGQRVNFGSITGTTGISAHTTYFVVNRAADTFQVAATFGGTALTLTTDGSGTVYVPEYKVAIVTVTPQAANNLVTLSLQKKHSQTGLQKYATTWLDIALNSASLTSWEVSLSTTITHTFNIEIARLGENAVANFSYMFNSCGSLRSLPALDTSSGTNFTGMFANCSSLRAIPFIDTSNGTNFSSMPISARL